MKEKVKIKTQNEKTVETDMDMWRLNGIQWSWIQIPLRPTFYSYF